jgi:hypothetical protein
LSYLNILLIDWGLAVDVLDALTTHAHSLLISAHGADLTPAVKLARSLHPTPPGAPAAVRKHLYDAPHVLPALARHAQAGDPHALLLAAVLIRDRLRRIAASYAGDDGDSLDEALAAFFALLRDAAEPNTLTERSITAHIVRRLHAPTSGPEAAVSLDPHAPVFDQAVTEPNRRYTQAVKLLERARDRHVITALEYQTLHVLYLQDGTSGRLCLGG